jgi:hypothetical protein
MIKGWEQKEQEDPKLTYQTNRTMEAAGRIGEITSERSVFGRPTIFFANEQRKHFFRQTSPTGGTYLECWVAGKEFAHILSTVELGSREKLKEWVVKKEMKPCTFDVYDSYFFQFCREVEAKRNIKSAERQKRFNSIS